ncbi:MAG: DegV family protein, partial [Candidatus Heimdallarchaeota archaeon]
ICGVIDSLEYLHRGGRIGRASRVLGTLLKYKPIVEVTEGSVNSFAKVKGNEEAFDKFVTMVPKIFDNLNTDAVWLGYAENKSKTDELYEKIKDLPNAPKEISIYEIGPTVGVHVGPGTMTISWIGNWNQNMYLNK